MATASQTVAEKFWIHSIEKAGRYKGTQLLGANVDNVSLQDLIDFLKEQKIEPSSVKFCGMMVARAHEV